MRCSEAKRCLATQRDSELAQLDKSDTSTLQEHLKQCPSCRAFEQRLNSLNSLLVPSAPYSFSSISTERILLAVQHQKRITQQLKDIQTRQQTRVARLRIIGLPIAALAFFTLGSIPLLLLALTIVQPDLLVNVLSLLGDVVGVLVILAQFVQAALVLITRDNGLLLAVAFVLVVMMGMWLRLMRHPQEA
jgi:predicted anti-sigma-YlaC factor YlaD